MKDIFHNRRFFTTLLALLVGLSAAHAAAQSDRIRLLSGSLSGEITGTTKLFVTIEKAGEETIVPIDQIRSLLFGGEPSALAQARINIANGGYKTALEKLSSISKRDLKEPLVLQDAAYYRALCMAKLATAGQGDATQAGRALRAFTQEHPDSHHYYGAVETMGDLLIALDRPSKAVKAYEQLAATPYVSMKVRSAVLSGRALQADEKHAEAMTRFDAAIQMQPDELTGDVADLVREQQRAAQLGKAKSLAATGQVASALELTRAVLRKSDPEATATLAAAYNTLGQCYEASGQSTDALLAYLHTDLLFPEDAAAHAEALYHLTVLWKEAGKREEAKEASRELHRRYAGTSWAHKLAKEN